MYSTKLRSQSKPENKKKDATANMESEKRRQIPSIEYTPKVARFTNVENTCPSSTGSPFKFIQVMDRRFERLAEQLQETIKDMFRQYEERLLSEIDRRLNAVKTDFDNLTKRVVLLESRVDENISSTKVTALSKETEELKQEIARLKDAARKNDNSAVANEIRIVGIPEQENENIVDQFNKICQTINIHPPEIRFAFRAKIKRNFQGNRNSAKSPSQPDPPIIVRFHSPYERNYVMKSITSYIKAKKDVLRLNIIGLNSTVPFYVNEHLTSENYRILQRAHHLKRRKVLAAVFVNRGLVYVKQHEQDEPTCMVDLETLNGKFRDEPDAQE